MSLPKHANPPSLSSSPSRQSIRRATDSTTPENPPSQTPAPIPQTDGHHDIHHDVPPPPSHQQDQKPFQPFFTLIEDANTAEYYHPTVHYIFSDDDSDIVTEAALRSLESNQDTLGQGPKGKSKPRDQAASGAVYNEHEEDDEFASPRKDALLPPPIPGVRDNYIILDMEPSSGPIDEHSSNTAASTRETTAGTSSVPAPAPQTQTQTQTHSGAGAGTGAGAPPPQSEPQTQTQTQPQFTIPSAHSLTPSWQVLSTEVLPAPTFETNTSNEPVNGGLMLKIQGTAGLPMTTVGKERDKEKSSQRLEDMMEQFSKRLGELRLVIEAGKKKAQGQGQEQLGKDCAETEEGERQTDTATEIGVENIGPVAEVDLQGNEGAGLGVDEDTTETGEQGA